MLRSLVTPAAFRSIVVGSMAAAMMMCGCDEGITPNNITISPASLQLALTDPAVPPVCSLSATAFGSGNNTPVPGFAPTFTSSNPSVATVQPGAPDPSTATVQGVSPGTVIITTSEPTTRPGQVTVGVSANGIGGVLQGASTTEGFVGRLNNTLLPTGAGSPPTLSSTSITGSAGGTASLTVGAAVPLADILLGIPGQPGYLDIPVGGTPPNRQVSPILNGFNVTMTIQPSLCQQQFAIAVVVEDAAGNFSPPREVIVDLAAVGRAITKHG